MLKNAARQIGYIAGHLTEPANQRTAGHKTEPADQDFADYLTEPANQNYTFLYGLTSRQSQTRRSAISLTRRQRPATDRSYASRTWSHRYPRPRKATSV